MQNSTILNRKSPFVLSFYYLVSLQVFFIVAERFLLVHGPVSGRVGRKNREADVRLCQPDKAEVRAMARAPKRMRRKAARGLTAAMAEVGGGVRATKCLPMNSGVQGKLHQSSASCLSISHTSISRLLCL
jgi:hypothetical protein